MTTPRLETVKAEVERARKLVAGLKPQARIELIASGPMAMGGSGPQVL